MITLSLELVPDPDDERLVSCFLPVTVNGVPGRALLDSGALRSAVVDRPGLSTREVAKSGGGLFGQGDSTERRAIVDLALGAETDERTSSNVEATVVSANHPGHGDLIGQDVLGRRCCQYRLGEATLVLDAPDPVDGQPIWVGDRGHVMVELAQPDGTASAAVFDTGASITIVDKTFAEDHPDLFEPDGESDGTDADGNTFSTPLVKIAPLTMLGSHFPATFGAVVDLSAANQTAERPMQMIVGWPLLRHGRFAIDHAAARASHEQSPPPVR